MNELLSTNYLTPASIAEAAESCNITVPELLDKAAEAYEEFVSNSAHQLMAADTEGMDKQAMEKLAYMDKQAFIFSLGTAAALASIPFSLWSGYDLARNTWGAGKDVLHGRFGKALKRAPAMAFDAMGVMPGVGAIAKAPKIFKALKSAKTLGKGIRGIYDAEQLASHGRKLAGTADAIKKLKAGKSSWWRPSTWTKGGRAARLEKLKKFRDSYELTEARAMRSVRDAWGSEAAKNSKWVQGDIGWGRAFGFNKEIPKIEDAHDKMRVFDILHSPKAHKFYQYADPWDAVSMIRMAPLVPLGAGALTGSEGLKTVGAKGLDYLNYYGDDPQEQREAMLAHSRNAAKAAGYMAGYAGRRYAGS